MSSSVYVAIPVMVFLAIIQSAVLPHFPIIGYVPILPLLVSLAWGLLRGANEAILWAFIAGFFLDLFSITPIGITSLTFMIAMLAVTWTGQAFPSSRLFLPVIQALLATLIYLFLYLLILQILGHQITFAYAASLAPISLLHGVLILPVYWFMIYIDNSINPTRVQNL